MEDEPGTWEIVSYDSTSKIMIIKEIISHRWIKNPKIMHLYLTCEESNWNLFEKTIIKRWHALREMYEGDENYTDYLPGFYDSISAMEKDQLQIIHD